jgi:steroid delta-isomerase-like uncharacterized protein
MCSRIIGVISLGFIILAPGCAQRSSPDTNAEVVRTVIEEAWNLGNLQNAERHFADDFVNHDPNPGGAADLAGYKSWVLDWRTAFPELRVEIHDVVAEADRVGVRFTLTGTHNDEFFGLPASGLEITMKGITVFRLDRGRIVEIHRSYDLLGVGQQLGYFEPKPVEVFPISFVRRTKPSEFMWGEPSSVTGATGDPDSNKALTTMEVEDGWNQGDTEVALEMVDSSFVWHSIYPEVTSYESYAQWVKRSVHPDNPARINMEALFAADDKVVDVYTVNLGKRPALLGIRISRFVEGRLVEMWRNENVLPILIDMGLYATFPVFKQGTVKS